MALCLEDRSRRRAACEILRIESAYRGRLWSDVDAPGEPSPWVTLRACRFLRAAVG